MLYHKLDGNLIQVEVVVMMDLVELGSPFVYGLILRLYGNVVGIMNRDGWLGSKLEMRSPLE